MKIFFYSNNHSSLPKLVNFCNEENIQLVICSEITQSEIYKNNTLAIYSYEFIIQIKDKTKIQSPYVLLVDQGIKDYEEELLLKAELVIPTRIITDISLIQLKKLVSRFSISQTINSLYIDLNDTQMTLKNKKNGKHLKLSPAEFSTLKALFQAQNTTYSKVISKTNLARNFSIHPNVINEDSVNVVVSRLKKKMAALKINNLQIVNVPQKGFTLIIE